MKKYGPPMFNTLLAYCLLLFLPLSNAQASEADLVIPDLTQALFQVAGLSIDGWHLLFYSSFVLLGTLGTSLFQFKQILALPVHHSMAAVAEIIFQTCKTYLIQQGKFLLTLFAVIAATMSYYFMGLQDESFTTALLVLFFTVIGMIGSYAVAYFGIRVNTYANSRTAFASLRGKPWDVVNIPLQSGMSIGLFLISLELILMLIILLFLPKHSVGYCFLGFAIGESLCASVLRVAGGIFTKIADIGSDLMKIIFNMDEDDPRNPGVIADCTGDNAGDSVGPTADGFETYGVTGVALISCITLAVHDPIIQAKLIVWIFALRIMMAVLSCCSYYVNQALAKAKYQNLLEFDFEEPLTRLIWIAAILCISCTFGLTWLLLNDMQVAGHTLPDLWWRLAIIISCGTLAAVLIPEATKVFTSSHSKHVHEIVIASREGGPSLTILSGIVTGNFSAFWHGMLIALIMAVAFAFSLHDLVEFIGAYNAVFAFGLVAFGFLGMGPVTIAVDSFGSVTDNAQSIFELSQIENIPHVATEIQRDSGFEPNFELGKHYLELNDATGNTFKATAKPVLIGTAVVGATTMIFSIILLLDKAGMLQLSLTDAPVLLGFICGGAVIYWFSGASMQAVSTGAYRAVSYIKETMDFDKQKADLEDSITVVKICTEYAQKGMWNIFVVLISITLAFACFDPNFFVSYLLSIAVFGLFQAIYMANAGGAWDNAKKLVEVDFKEKNTPLHAATVIGDTVGDPFKDTSSVALNPIIKFSSLFGLLAVEIAIKIKQANVTTGAADYTVAMGVVLLTIALIFVWRSFYAMRIPPHIDAKQ
ncbi:MAG: sodium-translocating pyrophosphatase [Methylovulum sp.]|nr:sodium-translocating pyrophosphatase [Methylovulum sp.]MCF8000058.1 sodium-translocating pyrophosphatase [Methylovulum sp.]